VSIDRFINCGSIVNLCDDDDDDDDDDNE